MRSHTHIILSLFSVTTKVILHSTRISRKLKKKSYLLQLIVKSMYLPELSATFRLSHKVILKRIKAGLYRVSFKTNCDTNAKNYLPIAGVRNNRWIHAFPKGINVKLNANSLVQRFELGSPISFLMGLEETLHGVIAKVLDSRSWYASSNSSHTITFNFST